MGSMSKQERIDYNLIMSEFYSINGLKYTCKKCEKIIRASREQHYLSCNGLGVQRYKKSVDELKKDGVYQKYCNLGCGQISVFFYKTGKSYCSNLGNSCPVKTTEDSNKKLGIDAFKARGQKRNLEGFCGWNKGLTKETSNSVERAAKKSSQSLIKWYMDNERSHSPETKDKIRNILNERYASGWQSTSCGRAKSYPHSSPIAGDIVLTGTWELAFAQILDKLNINWEKNRTRFDYVKPCGTPSTYLPDFFIKDWGTYVEVKGYETDLDQCKWEHFKEPLIVVKKAQITKIKKWLKENTQITIEDLKSLVIINK